MFNFESYNPTQILCDQAAVAKIGNTIPDNAKVLIIGSEENAKQNRVLAQVVSAFSRG